MTLLSQAHLSAHLPNSPASSSGGYPVQCSTRTSSQAAEERDPSGGRPPYRKPHGPPDALVARSDFVLSGAAARHLWVCVSVRRGGGQRCRGAEAGGWEVGWRPIPRCQTHRRGWPVYVHRVRVGGATGGAYGGPWACRRGARPARSGLRRRLLRASGGPTRVQHSDAARGIPGCGAISPPEPTWRRAQVH